MRQQRMNQIVTRLNEGVKSKTEAEKYAMTCNAVLGSLNAAHQASEAAHSVSSEIISDPQMNITNNTNVSCSLKFLSCTCIS